MVDKSEAELLLASLIKMVGKSNQTMAQLEKRISRLEHQRHIYEHRHKTFILQKPVQANSPK